MIFIQDVSTNVELPELADVIVSDMSGVLPMLTHNIPSVIDARQRLLTPGGTLIPQRDRLLAAPVSAPDAYERLMKPWGDDVLGLDMSPGRALAVNVWDGFSGKQHTLVAGQEKALWGPRPRQAVAILAPYLDNIRQAWQWAIAHQHWPAVERSLEGLGRYYGVEALLSEGEAMFAQAAAGFQNAPRLLIWQAYFLSYLGQMADAVALAERALAASDEDATARAAAQSLLGELLPSIGTFEEAEAYQKQAIEHFRSTGELDRLAQALRRMGMTCWRGGDHSEALRYFEQAIPILQAIEEKRGLAQIYNLLSAVYYEQDDLNRAVASVRQAQVLFEAIEDKQGETVVAANLGRFYAELGQFEEALPHNQRAIELSGELGDRRGLARDLNGRGFILAEMGDYDRSLDYYYRALDVATALEDPRRMADFQAGIAAVYAAKGDDATAMTYFDLALPVLLEQGVPYHIIGPLLGKAELLVRRGDWEEARELCVQAEAMATEMELPEYIRRSRALAAELEAVAG